MKRLLIHHNIVYCLQDKGTIKGSKESVAHYWNLKEFRSLLQQFFKTNEEESIPNLVKTAHPIDAKKIESEKDAYEALPLLNKWKAALTGRAWTIKKYLSKI